MDRPAKSCDSRRAGSQLSEQHRDIHSPISAQVGQSERQCLVAGFSSLGAALQRRAERHVGAGSKRDVQGAVFHSRDHAAREGGLSLNVSTVVTPRSHLLVVLP